MLSIGISTLEYTVPLDGANINKTINVCTCEELSNLIANNDTCVQKLEDDPDTLDISDCTISKCYDGLQDITVVSISANQCHFYIPILSVKALLPLCPTLISTLRINSGITLKASNQIQRLTGHSSMWSQTLEWLWGFTVGFRFKGIVDPRL